MSKRKVSYLHVDERTRKKIEKRRKAENRMRDVIEDRKYGINVSLKHGRMEEPSRVFCDKIEYLHDRGTFKGRPVFDHHLMFWLKDKLVFKVWLPQGREYGGVLEALEDAGFEAIKMDDFTKKREAVMMESKVAGILAVLENGLLLREDVYAAFLARKDLEGIIPSRNEACGELLELWSVLKGSLNEVFDCFGRFREFGLDRMSFTLRDFRVFLCFFPGGDTAVAAVCSPEADEKSIRPLLEAARNKISNVIEDAG